MYSLPISGGKVQVFIISALSVLLLALIVTYWKQRRRGINGGRDAVPPKIKRRGKQQFSGDRRWRAVRVVPGKAACARVEAISPSTWLVGKAPALPLSECGQASCHCKYQQLEDRRQSSRRDPFATVSTQHGQVSQRERRRGRGRRSTDMARAV